MATWGAVSIPVPTEFCVTTAAAAGETLTTGHATVAAVSYSGSDVSTNLQVVADLDAPSAWTTVVGLTGGPLCVNLRETPSNPLCQVDSGEDAGEGIRVQILVDGTTALDVKVVKDTSDTNFNLELVPAFASATASAHECNFFCMTSFTIKACCKGTFANSDTKFISPKVSYSKISIS